MSAELRQLSEREREILRLVAAGLSNQQIADRLGVSINTIKVHLRNVFGKIGVASRTEATMYALRTGIVTLNHPEQTADPATAASTVIDQLPSEQEPSSHGAIPQDEPVPPITVEAEEHGPPPQDPPEALRMGELVPPVERRRVAARRHLLLPAILVVLVVVGGIGVALGMAGRSDLLADSSGLDDLVAADRARWKELPDVRTARAAFAVANVDNLLYVIGGENQTGVLNTTERFNPGFETWTALSNKPTAVTDVHAEVLGGKIYIPGGRRSGDSKDITSTFERYDPRTETWEKLPDLPQPRSAYALAALEGKLYLIGGWDGASFRSEVFEYDPDSARWRERASIPTPRAFADAAVDEGRIYVLGGENESGALASNEVYTPAEEEVEPWERRAPLPQPRSRFGSAVALSTIYVIGGAASDDTPLKYDTLTDSWQSFAPGPQAVGSQPGVVMLETTIVSMGGRLAANSYSRGMQGYQALFTILLPR